jgi:hypothetical protein
MIAASQSPRVGYLWEPFSPLHRPGICDARFPYWFTYVCIDNAEEFAGPLDDMLSFRYRPAAELRAVRSPKDMARMARDWTRFVKYRQAAFLPLMKDPIAVFSAEWLCDTFNADAVVMIRHPAAFANSLLSRGYIHPFDHFLKQPLLMRDALEPFAREIRAFSATPRPILDQAILLWRMIYSVVVDYRSRRDGWTFLRLEDVASDPLPAFRRLFARLGLAFDENVQRTVLASTAATNPSEVASASDVKRDSGASVVTWKKRLTREQIDHVRAGVDDVAKHFYDESDW